MVADDDRQRVIAGSATARAAMDWSGSRPFTPQGNALDCGLMLLAEGNERFFEEFCIGLPISTPVTSRRARLDGFVAVWLRPRSLDTECEWKPTLERV